MSAQISPEPAPLYDSSYIADHSRELVLRAYGSHKFTRLSYGTYDYKEPVLYKPNSNYNIGVGFNYRFLGINLGFRSPFVNNDNDRYGKTKYLDLQAYIYARKMTIDFYGQTYEGYYLDNNAALAYTPPDGGNLIRSDIQTRNIGANVEYLFNHRRFSYRAAYIQNERQKKSAGSPVLGGGVHFIHVRADSAIIPAAVAAQPTTGVSGFNRSAMVSATLNGGYAHTFVIRERFFIMGALTAGAGVDYLRTENTAQQQERGNYFFYTNAIVRCGAGYNADRFYAGVYFTTNLMRSSIYNAQQYETGLLRVAVARRFTHIPKAVRLIDKGAALLGIQ